MVASGRLIIAIIRKIPRASASVNRRSPLFIKSARGTLMETKLTMEISTNEISHESNLEPELLNKPCHA